MKRITMLLGTGFLLICSTLFAAVPQLINFQGILRDGSGNPVANGSYSVIFTIYDAASGGTNLWSETQSVTTNGGLFTILLGNSTSVPDSVFNDSSRWLGVKVGTDPEMTPRQRFSSVGFSQRSSEWTSAGPDLFRLSGNVGIGTAAPGERLHLVRGDGINSALKIENSISGTGVVSQVVLSGNPSNPFQWEVSAFESGYFLSNNNVTRLAVDNGGNVGIGTTSPTARLDVAGGNLNLENSSATAGNILKGGVPFIHNRGYQNTCIGLYAGNLTMVGSGNTASGAYALYSNDIGSDNTANGDSALYNNINGFQNTAIGIRALLNNNFGIANTASGAYALYNNTAGNRNTASGFLSLFFNTTADANTATGYRTLHLNTTGVDNTASGRSALHNNTTGSNNTASGSYALSSNNTGSNNTALGYFANVSAGNLTNATAIGANAIVDASDKIRLGDTLVSVIEGQVAYSFTSDKNQKENFRPVDGAEVLKKIQGLPLSSWNYKGHDPKQFRHYGPMAQDFFAAFGDDGVGKIGTETTLNSGDVAGILMVAVQALEKEKELMKAENAGLKARMEQLEKQVIKLGAEKPQAEVR